MTSPNWRLRIPWRKRLPETQTAEPLGPAVGDAKSPGESGLRKLTSEVDRQPELDAAWNVALATGSSEIRIAPILVWRAEVHPVENVAHVSLKPHVSGFAEMSVLEDTEVLVEERHPAQVRICSWLGTELQCSGIGKSAAQKVGVLRIGGSEVESGANFIGPLVVAEEEAAEVAVHADQERTSRLVNVSRGKLPSADHLIQGA